MTYDDWRYLWIKELTNYGVSIESATRAFKSQYRDFSNFDTSLSPQEEVNKYLANYLGEPSYILDNSATKDSQKPESVSTTE